MKRGHVCGTQRLRTCTQQQNPPPEGVNGRGYLAWRHTGSSSFPFPRALESPLNGRKLGGKSFPGRKGERWDYRTEAPAFPLDCSLIPQSVHVHLCVHTHMHTATLSRE